MHRVLVVGDVASLRRIVVAALRARGLQVSDVDVGREALSRLSSEQPDVLVLHPPGGVFARPYFEMLSNAAPRARIFVITESDSVHLTETSSSVAFVSRTQVLELVESVYRVSVTESA